MDLWIGKLFFGMYDFVLIIVWFVLAYFVDFVFFFRRRRHNKFILFFKKTFKNPIKKKQILHTFMFFNKLLLTENFMICFFVENNEKSYVTIFIEKSSAFMKITLLFY